MASLFLVVHGETGWESKGRIQGWLDMPLNEKGRSQAEELAEDIKGKGIKVIYSSPLSRAYDTAKVIAEVLGIDRITKDDRLKEYDQGKDRNPGIGNKEGEIIVRQFAKDVKDFGKKNIGKVPGYLERYADEYLAPPKVNWKKELKARIRRCIQKVSGMTDYAYSRPSRRHSSENIIFPSMIPIGLRRPVADLIRHYNLINWIKILWEFYMAMCQEIGQVLLSLTLCR